MLCQLLQAVQILHGSLALCDLLQDLQHPPCAHPAGCTLAAGFIYRKLQEELGDIYHTGILIHDDKSAGSHHGADGDQIVIVYGHVKVLCRDTSAGRAAGLGCLELLTLGDAAADLLHDLPQGGSHGDLHQSCVVYLSAQGEDLGSLGLLGSHGGEPLRSVEDDLGNIGKRLYVI